jgi:hypothetical protein
MVLVLKIPTPGWSCLGPSGFSGEPSLAFASIGTAATELGMPPRGGPPPSARECGRTSRTACTISAVADAKAFCGVATSPSASVIARTGSLLLDRPTISFVL